MKVHCVYHQDNTASMEIYEDGFFHCFGCGAHGPVRDLPIATQTRALLATPTKEKEVEDLANSIQAIEKMPKLQIRGLTLPTDGVSYYIVWPDKSYYNRRQFEGEPKYKCPSGHRKRLLVANAEGSGPLAIVEGEINALSLSRAYPYLSVVSPGGAQDFYSKHAEAEFIPSYKRYSPIYLFADEDKAGTIACLELAYRLKPLDVRIYLLKKDFNDLLVEGGVTAIEKALKERGVDLCTRVPFYG